MEKIYSIYVYIYGSKKYSYSIMIENHYRLVIDLWCRHIGYKDVEDVLRISIGEAVKEYIDMGLGDIPVRIYLQDIPAAKRVMDSYIDEVSKVLDVREVIYWRRWRVRRLRELALYCYKNSLDRYPPSLYL